MPQPKPKPRRELTEDVRERLSSMSEQEVRELLEMGRPEEPPAPVDRGQQEAEQPSTGPPRLAGFAACQGVGGIATQLAGAVEWLSHAAQMGGPAQEEITEALGHASEAWKSLCRAQVALFQEQEAGNDV